MRFPAFSVKGNLMKYTEVTVRTTTEGAELVSDLMWNYSPYGVAIYDKNDFFELARSNRSWDYVDETVLKQSPVVLVKGYMEIGETEESLRELRARLSELKQNWPSVGSLELTLTEVDGDEWIEKWKEHFRPIKIGKIVICPEWIQYRQEPGEQVVKLDSNMAFGTGEHETTSMCIDFLQRYIAPGDVVLDVGCGSGILGISAEKLGAERVIMTDIDECAIDSARHNCEINQVKNYEILQINLLDEYELRGNLILVNIMAEILIAFSSKIARNLLPGGTVILSGILKEKLDPVLIAYKEHGFAVEQIEQKGEWCAVALKQREKA